MGASHDPSNLSIHAEIGWAVATDKDLLAVIAHDNRPRYLEPKTILIPTQKIQNPSVYYYSTMFGV